MPDGFQQDDLTTLPLPMLQTDHRLIGRGDNVYTIPMNGLMYNPSARIATITRPQASDFSTWVNQDSGTITDDDFGTVISSGTAKGNVVSIQSRVRSLPAGTAWTVELGLQRLWPIKAFIDGGIILRESATGKLESAGFGNTGGAFQSIKWTSPTGSGTVRYAMTGGYGHEQIAYLRAVRNGTSLQFWVSLDGLHWLEFGASFLVNNFFTTAPDQWGLFLSDTNQTTPNINALMSAFHWDAHT